MKPLVLALVLMMMSFCLAANRKDFKVEMHEHEQRHLYEDENVEFKHPQDLAGSDHHYIPRPKYPPKNVGDTGETGNK